jgi:Beta-lactamase
MSSCFFAPRTFAGDENTQKEISDVIADVIRPLMREYRIPGMAVAVTVNGENYFYNYGVASIETQKPITSDTLFEIGSDSKIFTATLASYAQVNGKLCYPIVPVSICHRCAVAVLTASACSISAPTLPAGSRCKCLRLLAIPIS